MKLPFRDYFEFFRQFRQQFHTTGAFAPSSRFLAHAVTGPLRQRTGPVRILEVGPGTGAFTNKIVRLLQPEDQLDLVELNDVFAEILTKRFETNESYRRIADQSQVHVCGLQDFEADQPYDYIISGLPLNNFPADLVRELFAAYFRLLAPEGTLSYFEYMYVRTMRKFVGRHEEKSRIRMLDEIMGGYVADYRFARSWVFVNMPPAWVQHLRRKSDVAVTSQIESSI